MKVSDIIAYGSTYGEVYRIPNQEMLTNSMVTEFEKILNHFFPDRDWWLETWFVHETDEVEARQLSSSRECLCSHKIHKHCYIRHLASDLIFLVGSSCMTKVVPGQYLHTRLKMMKERRKTVDPEKEEKRNERKNKEFLKMVSSSDQKLALHRELIRKHKLKIGEIRLCRSCKVAEITGSESWKTQCLPCYKKEKSQPTPGEVTRCLSCRCDITAYRQTKGMFIKHCLPCYIKGKK